jgi:thiol-disulfide isomerase/thioredoxin
VAPPLFSAPFKSSVHLPEPSDSPSPVVTTVRIRTRLGFLAWLVAAHAGLAEAVDLPRVSERLRGQDIAAQTPPLDNPEIRSAPRASHMRDEDTILGVVVDGHARAYPWWVLKNHHVVNDTIGRTPLAVSLCEQCTGGAAFRRVVDGRTLSMRVAGVYNGTIVLQDRATGTLFSPFGGRGLEGPLAGRKLERLPLVFTHWDEWLARHPDTDVVFASPALRGGHGAFYTPGSWGILSEMGSTIVDFDARLPENALVYGVESGPGKSYPLAQVRARGGVVNDVVGAVPVVIVARGTLEAAGFERGLDGRVLTFQAAPRPPGALVDEETGSRWSIEGEAIGGPLLGKRLAPLDGYSVEWHVWSAYNPRAEVFAEATAPRAGSPTGLPADRLALPALTLAEARAGATPRALRLDGAVNLVVLFAAWCPPCRVEMPRIQQIVDEHAASGVRAFGIAVYLPEELEREAVRHFLDEAKITFPTFLVDDTAYEGLDRLARSAGGPGIVLPTVFVVNPERRVRAVLQGREVESLPGTVTRLLDGAGAGR